MSPDLAVSLWPGPHVHEAVSAYHRARQAGLSTLRALVIGVVGSFKDCWMFRREIAKQLGISVRTVARAFLQARREGLLNTARGKKTEVPPGAKGPIPCGFSHRWLPGWGKAGAQVQEAISRARAKFTARAIVKGKLPGLVVERSKQPARHWTAAELDAELERLKPKPPPEAPPRD